MLRAVVLGLAAMSGGVAAAAGPFDGLYRPNYDWASAWDCESVGRDGGALSVSGDRIEAVENSCRLDNPVDITGMAAVLYDATCSAEGAETRGRIMLMAHDFGIYVIRDGLVLDWLRCEGER